jgi:hypothetical protein
MPKITTFVWEKWQKWTWQLEVKWKLFYGGALRRTSKFFLLEREYLKLSFLDYAVLNNLLASEIGSTKVRILYFFHILFYIFSCNLKTTTLTKLSYTSLKSWLKNLSNEYIYAELNSSKTWDISFQSCPLRWQKRLTISTKFWLWRPMLGNRRQPGVLYFGVFLVGALTIKQKTQKHDLKESLPGFMTTLLPTVTWSEKCWK